MTDLLEALRAQFIDRCRADLVRLETFPEVGQDMSLIIHRLAGAAGSFGFPELSRVAAEIDLQTRNGMPPSGRELDELKESLRAVIGQVS